MVRVAKNKAETVRLVKERQDKIKKIMRTANLVLVVALFFTFSIFSANYYDSGSYTESSILAARVRVGLGLAVLIDLTPTGEKGASFLGKILFLPESEFNETWQASFKFNNIPDDATLIFWGSFYPDTVRLARNLEKKGYQVRVIR